jgi:16S rRNA (cytosine967-C5)-methyltransferase
MRSHDKRKSPAANEPRPRAGAQTARSLALQVLSRAGAARRKSSGAVTDLLSESLRSATLSRRDESLATELVYSALRRRLTLDWMIRKFSGVELKRIEQSLLNVLRLGVLQLVYLGGVPDYAAVDESVKLARRILGSKAAGFANSVLRKVAARASSVPFPRREDGLAQHISVVHSHPAWLVRRWLKRFGEETTVSVCIADNTPPPMTARVNTLKTTREKLIERMAREGAEAIPAEEDQTIEIVRSPKPLPQLRSFREGLFYLQDISATIAPRVLGPVEGERILDLCSAPGGKATHIAELMRDRGLLVACDIDEKKMPLLRENIHRLGTSIVRPLVADGTAIGSVLLPEFDRVLIDAPCSNTGVLRRRVEVRWRLNQRELKRLRETQSRLLRSASMVLKPGGVLVYSTCSIEREENEDVIAEFLGERPDFELKEEKAFLPGENKGDGGYVAKLVKR